MLTNSLLFIAGGFALTVEARKPETPEQLTVSTSQKSKAGAENTAHGVVLLYVVDWRIGSRCRPDWIHHVGVVQESNGVESYGLVIEEIDSVGVAKMRNGQGLIVIGCRWRRSCRLLYCWSQERRMVLINSALAFMLTYAINHMSSVIVFFE